MSKADLSKAILALSWSDMVEFADHVQGCTLDDNNRLNDRDHFASWIHYWATENAPETPEPPKPDDDDWIPHYGRKCPVYGDTLVDVKFRDGETIFNIPADIVGWYSRTNHPGNIVAYRVVKP